MEKDKANNINVGMNGYIVFNEFGDVWMASHSKERLQEFIEQHPWLKLETITPVGHKQDAVKMLKPRALRDLHAKALRLTK